MRSFQPIREQADECVTFSDLNFSLYFFWERQRLAAPYWKKEILPLNAQILKFTIMLYLEDYLESEYGTVTKR